MTPLVITPGRKSTLHEHSRGGALGIPPRMREQAPAPFPQVDTSDEIEYPEDYPASSEKPAKPKQSNAETFDKVVGRIPTFYAIIFFSVFTTCAVLIIWNTLQVNRLTLEKSRLESKIEQSEQRIIKLKAQEMQLSAPDRIRDISRAKLGMTESTGNDEVIVQ